MNIFSILARWRSAAFLAAVISGVGLGASSAMAMPPANLRPQAEPPGDGNSSARCADNGSPISRSNVILATGEKIERDTDFAADGLYGLEMTRTYRAFANTTTAPSSFGNKWYSSVDYAPLVMSGSYVDLVLGVIPQSVVVGYPDGSRYTYTRGAGAGSGAPYMARGAASMGQLAFNPGVANPWVLTRGDLVYSYSSAGVLQSIAEPGGLVLQQFVYDSAVTGAASRPTQIIGAGNRSMSFTWANGRITQVIDPAGNTWSYGYNANGMLTSVTPPGSSTASRTYFYGNSRDASLITGTSRGGVRYSTYTYYDSKQISSVSLTGNVQVDTFAYGTKQTTLTNAAGNATSYAFASNQGALKLVSTGGDLNAACNTPAQVSYDANGWPSGTVDGNGNQTSYSYGSAGRLLQITAPTGDVVAHTWNGNQLVTSTFSDSNGAHRQIGYTYVATGPAAGRLNTVTVQDLVAGAQAVYAWGYSTYTPAQTLSAVARVDALPGSSATTTWAYGTSGNLTILTNALGQKTTWGNYTGLGAPGRSTDPNGNVTTYAYDAQGGLTSKSTSLPQGARTTTYAYDDAHRLVRRNYPDGKVDQWGFNGDGSVAQRGNARNEFVGYTYTPTSINRSSSRYVPTSGGFTALASPFSTTRTLDNLQRVVADDSPNGHHVGYGYDGNGNLTSVQDSVVGTTTLAYDAADRLTQVTTPSGTTRFAYARGGQVASMQVPGGVAYTYSYDVVGRQVAATSSDGSDSAFTWDVLGRLTTYTSPAQTVSYTYDQGPYAIGRLTATNDSVSGSSTYSYGPGGDLVQQVVGNAQGAQSATTTWSYDAAGRVTATSFPGGLGVGYSYDNGGRLALVTSDAAGWATVASGFLYEPATDRLYGWTRGDGSMQQLTLDSDGLGVSGAALPVVTATSGTQFSYAGAVNAAMQYTAFLECLDRKEIVCSFGKGMDVYPLQIAAIGSIKIPAPPTEAEKQAQRQKRYWFCVVLRGCDQKTRERILDESHPTTPYHPTPPASSSVSELSDTPTHGCTSPDYPNCKRPLHKVPSFWLWLLVVLGVA